MNEMIPLNIIQFWHDFNDIPEVIEKAMEVTKNNNNNYSIIQADDNFMRNFIKNNYQKSVLKLYNFNKISASRSDLARLMLLYEYGGFYIDASMELQDSLDKFINKESEVIVVRRDDVPRYADCPESAHFINGFIAAPKKSKFIKWCIDKIISNLVTGDYNRRVNIATGPAIINQAVMKYENKCKIDTLSFSSLHNAFFIYRRVSGVNNSWVCTQKNGIIKPEEYKLRGRQYEKLWFGKKILIRVSFSLLFTGK